MSYENFAKNPYPSIYKVSKLNQRKESMFFIFKSKLRVNSCLLTDGVIRNKVLLLIFKMLTNVNVTDDELLVVS